MRARLRRLLTPRRLALLGGLWLVALSLPRRRAEDGTTAPASGGETARGASLERLDSQAVAAPRPHTLPDPDPEAFYGPQKESETPLHKLLPTLALVVLALVLVVFNYAVRPLADLLPTRATAARPTAAFALAPGGRLAFVDAVVRRGVLTASGRLYLETPHGRRLLSDHAQSLAGLSFSPDGRTLAYLRTFDRVYAGPHANLCLVSLASGRERCPLFAVAAPAFSPSGQTLAYLGEGQALHLRQLASGGDHVVRAGEAAGAAPIKAGLASAGPSVSFSPDGRRLAYLGRWGHGVYVVAAGGGQPRLLWRSSRPLASLSSLAWTGQGVVVADGARLVRLSPAGRSAPIALVVARPGGLYAAARRLVRGPVTAFALSADGRRLVYLAAGRLHLLARSSGQTTIVAGPERVWTMRYKTR